MPGESLLVPSPRRAVGGPVGDGDTQRSEVAGLHGLGGPLRRVRLLRPPDGRHPTGHGGPVRLPARAPSALVRRTTLAERHSDQSNDLHESDKPDPAHCGPGSGPSTFRSCVSIKVI